MTDAKLSDNIVFFGTPPFAVATLDAIRRSGRKISLTVTQPDRPSGRGLELATSAVKAFCQKEGLPFSQPRKMKDPAFHEQLRSLGSRVFVVAAYGRILPTAILEIPGVTLNVHASLLPNWRGAAPIQRSIMAGDRVTGVSIMRLVEELDAGDVLLQERVKIGPEMEGGALEAELAECGAQALLRGLDLLDQGQAKFVPQDSSRATFAPPLEPEESRIHWSRTASEVHNHVRAFQPRPGTFTTDGRGRLKICRTQPNAMSTGEAPGTIKVDQSRLYVMAGEGSVEILELQREGKKRQDVRSFLSGYRMGPGQRWE